MRRVSLVLSVIVSVVCVQSAVAGSREDVFLKELQAELHRKGDPWIAGSTSVSHLLLQEKKKLCNLPLASRIPRDPKRQRLSKKPKNPPPQEIDWRSYEGHNWMTSVKSQEDCGACWAFGWVAAQEARMKISRDEVVEDYDLSEQFVISCNPYGYGCDGGMDDIGTWVQQDGIADEECFPYQAQDLPCSQRCFDWQERVAAIGGKITDWGEVAYPNADTLKQECMNGPTALGVEWPGKNGTAGGIREDFFYYKRGVYEPVLGAWIKAGHGVCLCGWDASNNWLIKNSWGPRWGSGGYGYIDYAVWWSSWMIPRTLAVPRIVLYDYATSETVWDAGEQTDLVVTVRNAGATATDARATISITGDPYVTIDVGSSSFGNIGTGSTADNSSSPFKITASASTPAGHVVPVDLHIAADGGYSRDYSFRLAIVFMPCETLDSFPLPPVAGDTCITYGLAYDGANTLYMTDFQSCYIYKFDKSGDFLGTIPSPEEVLSTTGIDYDGENDCLWVTNRITKMIYKVDPMDGSIISAFQSPAQGYPTGLAFDGTNLWVVDRDQDKIYEVTRSGATISSFTIPIISDYGPRGLAFDPSAEHVHGEGTLILYVTHYSMSPLNLDSCVIYEIKRDGSLIPEHRCATPGSPTVNGRLICVDPENADYWVDGGQWGPVYKVAGFHKIRISGEEKEAHPGVSGLTVSPNPTRDRTSISFFSSGRGKVEVGVYGITGRLVSCLVDKKLSAGRHEVNWRGIGTDGKKMPSGVYFCQVKTSQFKSTRKLVLLR